MTGMKEGAGDDPFAEEESTGDESESQQSMSGETTSTADDPMTEADSEASAETQTANAEMTIPYKYRRDSVQDGRDRVPLFLHPETKTDEREAMRELEERFDNTISLTDLREALMKAGLKNLDTTQEYLEEWGYGLEL